MILLLITLCFVTSHVTVAVNDTAALTDSDANPVEIKSRLAQMVQSVGGDPRNLCSSNNCRWWQGFIKNETASSVIDAEEDSLQRMSFSQKLQDLQSISSAILNFFNARNNTKNREKSRIYLDKLYGAIEMYFYHKENSGNTNEYVESDLYMEDILRGILNYRNHKGTLDEEQFGISYYINKIMWAIRKYQGYKKEQDQLKQIRIQEDLRRRLLAMLEVLNEFIRIGEQGQTVYDDGVVFLEEVLVLLLKYNKYRLNHVQDLSDLGIALNVDSEETFLQVFHAISVYMRKKLRGERDSGQHLNMVFIKISNHIQRIERVPEPSHTDCDSVVVQIFSALIRFRDILNRNSEVQKLQEILVLIQNHRPASRDEVLIKVFTVLLQFYTKYQDRVTRHPLLVEIFIAIESYIKYATAPKQGPDMYLEKVFAAIEVIINNWQVQKENNEIQIVYQICREVLVRYKPVLHVLYMREILIAIVKFSTAVTTERPTESYDVLYKIFKIILTYFDASSRPAENGDIQEIIRIIIKFVRFKDEGDNRQVYVCAKELFELVDTYLQKYQQVPQQTEIIQIWIKILLTLKKFYNPYVVVTEGIIDLTVYLRKILNQLITISLSDDVLIQVLHDLLNVYNYLNSGTSLVNINIRPLQDIFRAIAIFVQHFRQPNADVETTMSLLDDIYFSIQVYFSRNSENSENNDLNILHQILSIILKTHRRTPLETQSVHTQLLEAIFIVIQRERRAPAPDVLMMIMQVIWNVIQHRPVDFADPSFSLSVGIWREMLKKITYNHNINLAHVYVKQVFRLLIEYATTQNKANAQSTLTMIAAIAIKYENHRNNHPNSIIGGNMDSRSIWIQIIEAFLRPDRININDIDVNLKKLYEIIFKIESIQNQKFTYTVVKILMKVYSILLQPSVPNPKEYAPLANYLNAVIDKIIDLTQQSVTDEKVIIREIFKVIMIKSESELSKEIDFNEIVLETVEIIRHINSRNSQKALVKILLIIVKFINATEGNVIKCAHQWIKLVGPEDIDIVTIQILVTLLNTREYSNGLEPGNVQEIIKDLIIRVFRIIISRDETPDNDLRVIAIEVIKNVICMIRKPVKNPHVYAILTIILRIFDVKGTNGPFNWQQVLRILQLVLSGQARPGNKPWIRIIEVLKLIIAGNLPRPSTDPWTEIIEIVQFLVEGRDPKLTKMLVKVIIQVAIVVEKEDNVPFINILKILLIFFERHKEVIPGPGREILTIIIMVLTNAPEIADHMQQIIYILNLIITANVHQSLHIREILRIVITIIEKVPQDTTRGQRVTEILLILQLLVQNPTEVEKEWPEIVNIVIALLTDATPVGDPWQEILIILRPLIIKHPEQAPHLEKLLKLLIEIINSPSNSPTVQYQDIMNIIAVIVNKDKQNNDLKSIIRFLINFLMAASVKANMRPSIEAIIHYLEIVISSGKVPVIDPHKNLKVVSQTVITIDKYVNVDGLNLNDGCCGFLKRLLSEAPRVINSHYSYIQDRSKDDNDVVAKIVKAELAKKEEEIDPFIIESKIKEEKSTESIESPSSSEAAKEIK